MITCHSPGCSPTVDDESHATCRQPATMQVDSPDLAWLLAWAGRNLAHLQLSDPRLTNLHWVAGMLLR